MLILTLNIRLIFYDLAVIDTNLKILILGRLPYVKSSYNYMYLFSFPSVTEYLLYISITTRTISSIYRSKLRKQSLRNVAENLKSNSRSESNSKM